MDSTTSMYTGIWPSHFFEDFTSNYASCLLIAEHQTSNMHTFQVKQILTMVFLSMLGALLTFGLVHIVHSE